MANIAPDSKQTPRQISSFSSALVLCTVDFPIYFIESISERHIVIAGGGGSSKTGVHNQINVIELVPTDRSCAADLVMKYQTPDEIPDAIMSGSLMRDRSIVQSKLVSGGKHAIIHHFDYDTAKNSFQIVEHQALVDPGARAEVKTVKYTPGRIFTGAMDGRLTCWSIMDDGQIRIEHELQAHDKEIDDIDVDLVNQMIVTLSRDEGRFILWDSKDFRQLQEVSRKSLRKPDSSSKGVDYLFRSCKFAYDTISQKIKSADGCLLVASNPIPVKNNRSKICKWRKMKENEFEFVKSAHLPAADGIMAMTISQDGKYAAVGSRSGGVCVLEVKTLRNIYSIDKAHHNLVTSLEFLPPNQESLTLTNSNSCPLISVSIDRRVVLHRPRTQPWPIRLIKISLLLLVVYMLIYFLQNQYNLISYINFS